MQAENPAWVFVPVSVCQPTLLQPGYGTNNRCYNKINLSRPKLRSPTRRHFTLRTPNTRFISFETILETFIFRCNYPLILVC
jgi:hypothetical protein